MGGRRTIWVFVVTIALVLTACRGTGLDPGVVVDDEGQALGGGLVRVGSLVFDGQEIALTGITCLLDVPDPDEIDVGTVSEEGYRVFVSRSNPANPISAQVLDPDFVQWFPQGVSGDEAQRDGSTFTTESQTYFNNADDRTVEVSFTIDCP